MWGQPRLVSFLEKGLREGWLAHAYLFSGPPHVGKMTLALDFSEALNCSGQSPPCGSCPSCLRIQQGQHPDVLTVGLLRDEDTGRRKKEISIDQVREIESLAYLPPYLGKYKTFIIDGAEHLSVEATNALLKTLEEPPPQVMFLLLSAEEGDLLPTLSSRCQRLSLKRLTEAEMARLLAERWGLSAEVARLRSRLSAGCPGLGTDEAFFQRREQALETLERLLRVGWPERFACASTLATDYERERDEGVLAIWLGWWRDLLLLKLGCSEEIINLDRGDKLEQEAGVLTLSQVLGAIGSLRRTREGLRLNASPRLALEVLMLDLPRLEVNN